MMGFVFSVLIVAAIGVILWTQAPRGYVIHAARSRDVWVRSRRFPLAALFRDPAGGPLNLDGRMIGLVKGNSCLEYGVRDGDVVIARSLDDEGRHGIRSGDLVIINSETDEGDRPLRFRKVATVDDGVANFIPDGKGVLRSKSLTDIVARVELVGSY